MLWLLSVDVLAALLSPCKSDPTISSTTRMSLRPLVRLITPMLADANAEWKTYVGAQTVCLQSDLRQQRGSTAHEGTHILYTDRTHPWGVSASAAAEWADNRTNTHPNLISSTYTPPASRIDVFQWPGEMRCTYLHNEKATTGNSAHFSLQGALGENQSDKKRVRIR